MNPLDRDRDFQNIVWECIPLLIFGGQKDKDDVLVQLQSLALSITSDSETYEGISAKLRDRIENRDRLGSGAERDIRQFRSHWLSMNERITEVERMVEGLMGRCIHCDGEPVEDDHFRTDKGRFVHAEDCSHPDRCDQDCGHPAHLPDICAVSMQRGEDTVYCACEPPSPEDFDTVSRTGDDHE